MPEEVIRETLAEASREARLRRELQDRYGVTVTYGWRGWVMSMGNVQVERGPHGNGGCQGNWGWKEARCVGTDNYMTGT